MTGKLTSVQLEDMFRHESGYDTMPAGWTSVGAWIRVSSGKQDEANQVPIVIRYCIDRKYWPARWYVVHSKSAFHGKHQGDLEQAIADMRYGTTKVLVIWHSDRLERRHDQGKSKTLPGTLFEFVDAGGKVESVQEPQLGQTDFGSQLMTFAASLINNDKSKRISEQVNLSFDRIKANGAIYNGNVPWGFEIAGPKYEKRIKPTDVCCEYAPQIFEHCIKGDSLRQIAAWLDSEGVKPTKGGKWNEGSVRWIIRNRVYAGRLLDSEGKTILRCEAVVKPNIWERANESLTNRPKRGPVAKNNRPTLASLKCARCGSPMYRILASRGKGKRYFYRCTGRGPQRKGCGNMIRLDELDALVVNWFVNSDKPHRARQWKEGKNWESEISDVNQDLQELLKDILAEGAIEKIAAKRAELAHYTELNENRELGKWEYTDALNPDGSVVTKGQYFGILDGEGRREYLKSHDIRAQRVDDGLMVLIDFDAQSSIWQNSSAIIYDSQETMLRQINDAQPESR